MPHPIRGLAEFAGVKLGAAGVSTALHTYTVPANTLSADGTRIAFEYAGSFKNVAGIQLILKLGNTTLIDSGSITPAATGFVVRGRVFRSAKALQMAYCELLYTGASVFKVINNGAENLLTNLDLILSGLGTSLGDVELDAAVVELGGADA